MNYDKDIEKVKSGTKLEKVRELKEKKSTEPKKLQSYKLSNNKTPNSEGLPSRMKFLAE
jgi:hypothetical protein